MMSHKNCLTSLISLIPRYGQRTPDEVYISYLPSAHVLELCAQIGWLLVGIGIGYSSPFTLTDNSTAIKEGELGDIRVLKPTFMIAVPIVLERIKKAVDDKINKKGAIFKDLFQIAYQKKLNRMKAGRTSFILDKLVFNKIKESLGGRLETLLVGGSILNKDVHEFGQACFCPVVQAYGLTETCAAATAQYPNETTPEQVGSPVECCEVRLVDWPEGGYRCTDKPNPRGEIWIGGENVSMGYYNMPEKTKEDFQVINGVRYFATGDIGEMTHGENLTIIDRKKDLVKLQGGEYVSLNKVETVVKLMAMVDNCCVIANPQKSYCICLITPNLVKSQEFLRLFNVDQNSTHGEFTKQTNGENSHLETLTSFIYKMDENENLREIFNKKMLDHCLNHGLDRFEIPTKSKFVKEIWLPDSGLVTDSLKLKRKDIEKFYAMEIQNLYV
jgi:long-chain acyl-CoA synthetase